MICNKKAEVNYPTHWTYTIIGTDSKRMSEAVGVVIQPGSYKISHSKKSSSGKYVSLNVELVVFSKRERDQYFKGLGEQKDIRMVI